MRFEDLPKEIQDWVGSDKFAVLLIAMRDKYGFRTKFAVLPDAVFMLITKEISPEFLGGELMKNFETNDIATMGPLIDEFKQTALAPIKDPLLKWGVDINLIKAEPLPADYKKPEVSQNPEPRLINPTFKPTESGETIKSGEPFILHAEEEMKTASSGVSRRDLVRPSFYQPGGIENVDSSKPVTARIETEGLARESEKAVAPLTARTATPQPRVVHYSELKTPLDPFAGTGGAPAPAPESKKGDKKPEVHPDNIINLKDLPK